MKNTILLFLLFIIGVYLQAQEKENIFSCQANEMNQQLMLKDQAFSQKTKTFNKELSSLLKSKTLKEVYKTSKDTVYELPIVVHIIHEGEPIGTSINITDQEVNNWIESVNQVFATTYPGMDKVENGGAVIPVRLVLAKRDPDCNPTTGILRADGRPVPGYSEVGLGEGGASEESIRKLSRWDGTLYYNIYVVKNIPGAGGYAYYAGAHPSYDGTFAVYYPWDYFTFVLAHEIGHALGLIHTFDGEKEDNSDCPKNEDCTLQGDLVCDTEPIVQLDYNPCPAHTDINHCTNTYYQGSQRSIMSYYLSCYNRFTPGQRDRAIAQMLKFRTNLLTSLGSKEPNFEPVKNINPAACIPTSINIPDYNSGIGVENVIFEKINYQSGGSYSDGAFYIDHTTPEKLCMTNHLTADLTLGKATPLTISAGYNPHTIVAYIDYNDDGIFDENTEKVYEAWQDSYTSSTQDVIPPEGAVLNKLLRLRVIGEWEHVNISPCYTPVYGQIEDFSVMITSNLDIDEIDKKQEDLVIYTHNQSVFIENNNAKINKIEVYNMNGQLLFTKDKILQNKYELPYIKLGKTNMVIVKVQTSNHNLMTKKVLLK